MFVGDNKNRQRSGQATDGNWQYQNRTAGSSQHTTAEGVAAQHAIAGRRRFIPSGVGGWFFGAKIELPAAPYVAIAKQQIVHIQPAHAIVTTGIRDAANPTGAVLMARPGLWVALRSIPAQATVSGHDVWNLPKWPLPAPTNYDDATNFWLFLGEQYC